MKVAIVHDQLREFGGAERVLVALKKIYPQADIFTTTFDLNSLGIHKELIKNWKVNVSWFGKIPFLNRFYSPFRFLTPLIWESFNFDKYDLVISSSGSWMSKGIKTNKPTIHISYIHHPPRYLYGYETAIEWQKYFLIKIYGYIVNHFLRIWDFTSSQRADYLIANSEETKRRIEKFYRRDAVVIYPPVNIPDSKLFKTIYNNLQPFKTDYFLTVSRLARVKHIDVLIKAANLAKFNLKIVGSGRDFERLKQTACPTVEFLGNLSDQELKKIYLNAKAFLFASKDEEFGIAPVEAMGYALPVIAFRSGGLPEYLIDGKNGYLFDHLDENSLVEKVKKFESLKVEKLKKMRKEARKTAERFSEKIFKENILNFVNSKTNAGTS
ncbi:glycosyltransferase family 4 protein [Candidatus Roizmanbacteria bacterium CG07_land_8_20_14_0_80_34_15]|uniref:Glycosyltransferase family 4 protein n=1 Tax=Candidatus Roizmanbacteria bacterium CG07_land_8_20_14_0_80_34_15 TaxID=1974849 RepID=A0A2M6YU82_9BACT|nr:MAG: glycosyltransferase family 4 protein [Candidatus Roizmanbacteria bacterium CG07_land_8_20_14_0_80_34_15]